MNHSFVSPQFVPQSPLQRRYQTLRQQQQQQQQYDDDDEIEPNHHTSTPQRRHHSTTRSTPAHTPRITPRVGHHSQLNTSTINNTTVARFTDFNSSIIGTNVSNTVDVCNYSISNEETHRDAYFRQAAALDAEWNRQ
jgi:hypothetical protein